jgi:hypothetical protein
MADANGRDDSAVGSGKSDGWSTFEARMRRRRFDRCVKTAETALESSDRTRFQEALEEATALFPDAPEVRVLGQRAAERARSREQPVLVAAPVAQNIPPQSLPPAVEPAADFTLRPMVERAPLFGSISSPSYQEAPEPEEEVSEPEYPTFSVQQKRSRSVAGPLLAVVAVALFAVGGYAFTEYYLAQPQPASRTAAIPKADPAPAPMTSEKPSAPTVAPTPAAPTVSRPDPPPPDPTRLEEAARVPETAPSQPPKPASENTAPRAQAEDVARTSASAARAMTVPATTPPPAAAPPPTTPTTPAAVASPPVAPASAAPTSEPTSSRETSARETNPAPVTPVPTLPDSVATTGAGATPSAAPAAAAEAARTDAARPARPTSPRAEEEPQIRAVLARYETAYNRLDANAASNVYPGVNREALGRAFGGLISQRVSLGLCEITVAGNVGGASCNGKARWEPKVGSGARTADRHWTFNLRRDTDGWRIEQVVVR